MERVPKRLELTAASGWTIVEIVEHLVAVETHTMASMMRMAGEDPEGEGPAEDQERRDTQLIRLVRNRRRKQVAPANVRPEGRFASLAEARRALEQARAGTIEFAANTETDLRYWTAPHPFLGELDLEQWLMILAAHFDRHREQIEEILRADPH